MHIYSSLGLTQNLAAQAGSPIKKAQNQKLVEANNKLDAKPNNKANKSTASFKDTLTLSKQALGFQEIAKKYDLNNVSYKEINKVADELYESGLIGGEMHGMIRDMAYFKFEFQGMRKVPGKNEYVPILKDTSSDSERTNFTEYMNERLQYKLGTNSIKEEVVLMKKTITVLDKLTALRG